MLFAAVHGQSRSSQLESPGARLTLFQLGQAEIIDLAISETVHGEAQLALGRRLPGLLSILQSFISLSARIVADADLRQTAEATTLVAHREDGPVLAAAVACGSRYLVTLNPRHFPAEYRGVGVVTPGALVPLVRRHLVGLQQL